MAPFDPNQPGNPDKLFGLPYSVDEADIVILPIPWDVTVSYHAGTYNGPLVIKEASSQIDYSIPGIKEPWKLGIAMLEESQEWRNKSQTLRKTTESYIQWIERNSGKIVPPHLEETLQQVNEGSSELNKWVKQQSSSLIESGKIVGTIGGDHSTPLGLIASLTQHYSEFGILQIDAHMDLREAYEGFDHSHASIMFNALKNKSVKKLVQLGIRDYCEEELSYQRSSEDRVVTYFDQNLKEGIYQGKNWSTLVDEIISHLPEHVYISFDIDGLDPKLCPNTGTPVPGGLDFPEVCFLLKALALSGRKIIGFDLSEVSPAEGNDWDGNVGARVLYQLCAYTGISQGKLKFEE